MLPMQIAGPSMMSLYLEMRARGKTIGNGTGFIVLGSGGVGAGHPNLVTNWHIVSGKNAVTGEQVEAEVPDELVIHHHGPTFGQSALRSEALFDADGLRRWRQHPVHGHKVDVAVLPLSNVDDTVFYPYVLDAGPKMTIGPTDLLSVVGFPFGLSTAGTFAIWATGFTATEPDVDQDDLPMFLLDCRARTGQSGSPVIAYRAAGEPFRSDGGTMQVAAPVFRLFGIYSGRVNSESDLGRVWKVRAILSTLLNGK